METKDKSNRLHPLIAGAAVSVMLVSLVGVAAITGILPNSNSTTSPGATSSSATAPVPLVSKLGGEDTFITEPADPEPAPARNLKVDEPQPKAATSNYTNVDEPQQPKGIRNSSVQAAPKPAATSRPAPAPRPDYAYRPPVQKTAQARQICHSCGRIESVQAVQQHVQPSGVGIAAGAVIGGLLGNQVGDGNGRKLATVAGAVGGGYAGNEVERNRRRSTSYHVRVRMEDGSIRTFPQSGGTNGWQAGDRVRVVNGALTSQG